MLVFCWQNVGECLSVTVSAGVLLDGAGSLLAKCWCIVGECWKSAGNAGFMPETLPDRYSLILPAI